MLSDYKNRQRAKTNNINKELETIRKDQKETLENPM